jgi:colanic acid/amylovoran biosynthesis glycosyltransferase
VSRIGYLVSQYPATSHTFIRREVEAMRALGVDVLTYSVRRPAHAVDNEREARAQAETFTILEGSRLRLVLAALGEMLRRPRISLATLRLAMRHRVPGVKALVWALFHFVEALVLTRRLRADRVAHLHNHFGNAGATVGLLASRQAGIGWSLTLHGISEFDYPAGNLLPEKLAHARFAACVSFFGMAQAMRLSAPAFWPKLRVVRCAIDPSDLPAAPPRASGRVRRHLVCVGRLSAEKGHAGLFEALAMLAPQFPDLRLTLVGDGPEEARLKARAAELGLAERITFTGRLHESATLATVADSDMLVLPSFMEGLPIVLMEAMALGVPVIASRVAGIPELVADGETGLLFDPANWRGLAEAIARLADEPGLGDRFAAVAREMVADQFTYPAAAQPLADSLLDAHGLDIYHSGKGPRLH